MANANSEQQSIDYAKLQLALEQAVSKDGDRYAAIVNVPFSFTVAMAYLFLGIIMLVFVNEKRQAVQATAVAQTDFADNIDAMANIPAEAIFIPLTADTNLIIKAIKSGKPQASKDWSDLMRPVVPDEQARFLQASGGISFTAVHPLEDSKGAIVYSFFRRETMDIPAQEDFMTHYTQQVSNFLQS